MPSQTFFNLPEEKQKKIIDAAIDEFAEVPFAEASINKIIKTAEISRGSFYMYFDDKYDLVMYLLGSIRRKIGLQIRQANKDVFGDLKKFMLSMHMGMYKMMEDKRLKNFFRNVIVFFQGRPTEEIRRIQKQMPMMNEYENIYPFIDKNQFKFQDKESIIATIDVAFAIFKTVIFQSTMICR